MPVIGALNVGWPVSNSSTSAAFRQGLSEAGYVEGQNVAFEYRWAEGHYDRLHALAAELVSRKVDVIVAGGVGPAARAREATSTIPIVFIGGADPVAEGLVASLSRPGGNVTGINFLGSDLMSKRLELLAELVPQAISIGLLINPNNAYAAGEGRDVEEAARSKSLLLHVLNVGSEREIDAAFARLVELRAGALLISPTLYNIRRRGQLVALATRHAIPTIYPSREFATAGGLISYAASFEAASREAGIYVGKILRGARPADLPVLQPTKYDLVVNMKTAKALGLTVPRSILARADEVIE